MSVAPFFQSVELPKVNRNLFDKTFENKLSGNMGFEIPILVEECVPGDKYRIRPEIFCRMAPMIAPIMHRVDIYTHTFFVPMRLIWADFENYISGNTSGSVSPVKPYVNVKDIVRNAQNHLCGIGSLWDYIGLPTSFSGIPSAAVDTVVSEKINTLPLRAYQLIHNEYYRDKNLYGDNPWEVPTRSGNELSSDMLELLQLRRRCWSKDYFTSALPWAQRGPEVTIGLGTSAPIRSVDGTDGFIRVVDNSSGAPLDASFNGKSVQIGAQYTNETFLKATAGTDTAVLKLDPTNSLYADLSSASAITINALRRANSIQRFFERSAVGGSRLIESNFAHFGVKGKDASLQRPQYLGGSFQTLTISSVIENSTSANPSVQSGLLGSMAGNGISSSVNRPITHYCDEQGYIITILSVLPRASYQDGIPRMFSKFDRLDEYFPEFAHIGEQAIKCKEIFFEAQTQMDNGYNNSDFGYQSRFSDMKYRADEVHGDFKTTMDFWHMGRKFRGSGSSYESQNKPVLNKDFVECHPTHRIFNVTLQNYDKLYFDCLLKIKCLRPMPIFGTPSF